MFRFLFLLFSALPHLTGAQNFAEAEAELNRLGQVILTDKDENARLKAHEDMIELWQKILKVKGSYEYSFAGVPSVSILSPDDNFFRILTWQLYVNQETYRYGGLIQLRTGEVYVLKDQAAANPSPEILKMGPSNWYGALYYKVVPFKKGKNEMYILLGFNGYSFFNKRKIMEVLNFSGNKPQFGASVIRMPDPRGRPVLLKRMIMEYSAEVSVRLTYDEQLEMIVFDHLIMSGGMAGQGPVNVPDGSYSGFKYDSKEDKWVYINRLFEDDPVLEDGQAPIPEPKKEKEGLFGPK